jgi:hypothetical protein
MVAVPVQGEVSAVWDASDVTDLHGQLGSSRGADARKVEHVGCRWP